MKHPRKKNNLPARYSGKTYHRHAALGVSKARFCGIVNESTKKVSIARFFARCRTLPQKAV
ncbi:hypothetical protein DWUX_2342 [Desulfovibrio diazotrophicus]|nr:hypothetical protein DWUX_2342 [Desulfovibrio diazotrophicus]